MRYGVIEVETAALCSLLSILEAEQISVLGTLRSGWRQGQMRFLITHNTKLPVECEDVSRGVHTVSAWVRSETYGRQVIHKLDCIRLAPVNALVALRDLPDFALSQAA